MSEKLRIGMIGCGFVAQWKHMPALKSLEARMEMSAFSDLDASRAANAARTFGCPGASVFDDYRRVLDDPSIDVVHVSTPNNTHFRISVDALEAGKHVMCEKPMALSGTEARLMLEAARKTGKKLSIGYQNRFRDDALYLNEVCQSGGLGEIYYAQAHAVRRRAVPSWGAFLNRQVQGGGPLIDIGSHALDLTLWNMNNYTVESVTGSVFQKLVSSPEGNVFGPWDPAKFEVEDAAVALIRMKNGATVFLEASWALNTLDVREACTTLCGTKGGAEVRPNPDGTFACRLNTVMNGKLVEIVPAIKPLAGPLAKPETPGEREARLWLDAIINDTEPLVKAEEAAVVTEIIEAVYASAKSGKPVYFG
jgi:predicted dehydrogenase